jgi:hypothetical protein
MEPSIRGQAEDAWSELLSSVPPPDNVMPISGCAGDVPVVEPQRI